MAKRDWFDDYMDYKLSGCEEDSTPIETKGCFSFLLCVLAVLWVISELYSVFS